jgi:hypothetical protein
MSIRGLTIYSTAAFAGAAMLALSMSPASAFTLSGPSLQPSVTSAQIDKVWWRGRPGWGWHRGWGWRSPGWGWRGGWGHCWRGYYGRLHCN